MEKGITLIAGLGLLAIGLLVLFYRVSKIKAGTVTNATVLRVESKSDGDDVLYRPVLRFKNYKNEPMIFKPASYKADNNWLTGETIKILYIKDNYDDVSIISYWGTFWIALVFFCSASVFLLIAGGEYLAGRFFKTLKLHEPRD